jgi:protoheme ferro-lyase
MLSINHELFGRLNGLLVLAASVIFGACTGAPEVVTSEAIATAPVETFGAAGKADGVQRKLGVFLTSHGDIDEFEEIEGYIKSAFLKNVGVPLPKSWREFLLSPAYWLSRDLIEGQYEEIGPTNYRANAQIQAEAIEGALFERGIDAKVYIGYNFMPPFIEDTAEVMRKDGITDVVVFNKGAQFSLATLGESIEELEVYLHETPDWNPNVVAVRQFSDDRRFIELFAETLREDAQRLFPDVPAADVCLLIASHGLPIRLMDMGDPAVDQMRATVDELRKELPEYPIYHGFLNDDFFPGAEWVSPSAIDLAHEMRSVSCPASLMDSRLSFTTHHRATLFDLEVDAREILEEPDLQGDGVTPHPLYVAPKVVLGDQWDDNPGFAALMADLTIEALQGKGDLIQVQQSLDN